MDTGRISSTKPACTTAAGLSEGSEHQNHVIKGRDSVFLICQFITKTCVLRKPRSWKSIAGRGRHSDSARKRKL